MVVEAFGGEIPGAVFCFSRRIGVEEGGESAYGNSTTELSASLSERS